MAFDPDEIRSMPPRWLEDWRCPHCGAGAVAWTHRVGGEPAGPDGLVVILEIIECRNGHQRRIEGNYETGGL